jgi:hypothetical protein
LADTGWEIRLERVLDHTLRCRRWFGVGIFFESFSSISMRFGDENL